MNIANIEQKRLCERVGIAVRKQQLQPTSSLKAKTFA